MTAAGRREALLGLLVAASAAVFVARTAAPQTFAGPAWDARLLAFGALTKLAFQGLSFALALACARRFDARNPMRRAWGLLAAGLLGYCAGQAALARYQILLRTQSPFPSLADVFFLGSYPLLIAALVGFIRAYDAAGFPLGTPRERRTLLAGVSAGVVLVALPVLQPLAVAPTPPLEKAVALAYPLLDAVLLVPAALLLRAALRFRGGNVQRVWLALTAGVVGLAAGDVLFAYFSNLGWQRLEPLVDALYIGSYGCLALGTLAQRHFLTR